MPDARGLLHEAAIGFPPSFAVLGFGELRAAARHCRTRRSRPSRLYARRAWTLRIVGQCDPSYTYQRCMFSVGLLLLCIERCMQTCPFRSVWVGSRVSPVGLRFVELTFSFRTQANLILLDTDLKHNFVSRRLCVATTMVVVTASEPAAGSPPPIYAILRRFGDKVCTLAVREYAWWRLGTTEIVDMPPTHRDQEHKFFPTLAAAAQHVHMLMFNTRTDYMQSFEICIRGPVHEAILTTSRTGSLMIEEHTTSRVTCVRTACGSDRWMSVSSALPLIPPFLRIDQVMAESVRQLEDQGSRRGASSELRSGMAVQRAAQKRHASDSAGDDAASQRTKCVKRVKIKTRDGTVVWDRNPELVPPVAWVIRGHTREDAPRPGCGNSTLLLELDRIRVGPSGERRRSVLEGVVAGSPPERGVRRHISEMAEFTELLPEIWDERRPLLSAAQRDETEAAVRTALVQRLKLATQLSAGEMWSQAMGDSPCPVLE